MIERSCTRLLTQLRPFTSALRYDGSWSPTLANLTIDRSRSLASQSHKPICSGQFSVCAFPWVRNVTL